MGCLATLEGKHNWLLSRIDLAGSVLPSRVLDIPSQMRIHTDSPN